MPRLNPLAAVAAALLVGCAPGAPVTATAVQSATQTLQPSPSPTVTTAPGTPTPAPTAAPVLGTTTTQLNVRLDPLASSAILGIVPASATIPIVAKAPGGNWYQILYEAGEVHMGWVSADYVSVPEAVGIAESRQDGHLMASVREQINVRRGPGTEFDSMGILSPRDVVRLVGKDSAGAWLQVVFPAGPDGSGWVAASFLEAAQTDKLPIVAESGEVVGTSTPTGAPPVVTPTPAAAAADDDSPEAPGAEIAFAPSGAGSLIYSSDVSEPEGDAEDWIRFTPFTDSIRLELDCSGNATLSTRVLQDGEPSTRVRGPGCGESTRIEVPAAGAAYLVQISIDRVGNGLEYARYVLSVHGGN